MRRALLLGISLTVVACGGSSPPPEAPQQEAPRPSSTRRTGPAPQVSQELGALNQHDVNATFSRLAPRLMSCLERGYVKNEFLSGTVRFFVRIDESGRARFAYLSDSTLGDRHTERCMLDIVKAASWPLPQGGEGEASSSFDFDASPDVRPPVALGPDRAVPILPELRAKVEACPLSPGAYRITAYIDEDGKVLAAGVAPPSEEGELAADCIVDAVQSFEFASPGSWPGKLSFELR